MWPPVLTNDFSAANKLRGKARRLGGADFFRETSSRPISTKTYEIHVKAAYLSFFGVYGKATLLKMLFDLILL